MSDTAADLKAKIHKITKVPAVDMKLFIDKNGEIVLDENKALGFAREHGLAADRCFETWGPLLEREDLPPVVIVATGDTLHVEPALAALARGDKSLIPDDKFINIQARRIVKENVTEFWDDLKAKVAAGSN